MRAKFIYEKFEEESDPIHDLGIGHIIIKIPIMCKFDYSLNKWLWSARFLTYKGINHFDHLLKKYNIKINKIYPEDRGSRDNYYKGYMKFEGTKENIYSLFHEIFNTKEFSIEGIINGKYL